MSRLSTRVGAYVIVATRAVAPYAGSGSPIAIRRPPRVTTSRSSDSGSVTTASASLRSASRSASSRSPAHVRPSRAKWSSSAYGRPS